MYPAVALLMVAAAAAGEKGYNSSSLELTVLLQADRQEALVKAEQRRMAIERANKMLFDDTDDVKALHGKLLLSEVRTPLFVCI
jgi:hypothetical protein